MSEKTSQAEKRQPHEETKSIQLSIGDAERIYELYKTVMLADRHFMTCQSLQFRQFVQDVYKAASVEDAFTRLQALLEEKQPDKR